MAKGPEAKVKADVKRYLTSIGACQFWPVQTGYGTNTVDCLACWRGRFYAIECKAPGKKATVRQQHVLAAIATAGGAAYLIDAVGQLDRVFGS